MRRISVAAMTVAVAASVWTATPSVADHRQKWTQGPRCGGKFTNAADCSFRYRGGQLYVGASVTGNGTPSGGAAVRLEAVSALTGHRRVLLSCVTPSSGACAAGGSFDVVEHVTKGQKLFCFVEGLGRGTYECGTIRRK